MPCVPLPVLVSRTEFALSMGDEDIDKKPGKDGFNAWGMSIFLPHCGKFGRFRNVGKQQPKVHTLGFRYIARHISLPPLPLSGACSEHSFPEFLLQVWACARHRGYGPRPWAVSSLVAERARGGGTPEKGLPPPTASLSQRTTGRNKLVHRIWGKKLE